MSCNSCECVSFAPGAIVQNQCSNCGHKHSKAAFADPLEQSSGRQSTENDSAGEDTQVAKPASGNRPPPPRPERSQDQPKELNTSRPAKASPAVKKARGVLNRVGSETSKIKATMHRRRQTQKEKTAAKRELIQRLQADPEARRATFMVDGRCIWPHDRPSLEDVIQSGLYSKPNGIVVDRTKCAFCKVHIEKWKPTDDPRYEHARTRSSCVFVQQMYARGEITAPEDPQSGSVDDGHEPVEGNARSPPATPSTASRLPQSSFHGASTRPQPVSTAVATPSPLLKENIELQARIDTLRSAIAHEHEELANLEKKRATSLTALTKLKTENRALKLQANESSAGGEGAHLPHSTVGDGELIESASKEVLAGTVEALCEHLLNGDQISLGRYLDDFLLTFRSFTTWQVVWDTLNDAYNIYCADNGTMRQSLVFVARINTIKRKQLQAAENEDFEMAQQLKIQVAELDAELDALGSSVEIDPSTKDQTRFTTKFEAEQENMTNEKIRLRVVSVLKRWLERHYYDFIGEAELLNRFRKFMDQTRFQMDRALLSKVLEVAERRLAGESLSTDTRQPEKPIIPSSYLSFMSAGHVLPAGYRMNILEFSPVELARQLTLMEWEKYKSVAPKEMLGLAWSKKDAAARSPQLLDLIDRFNLVSNWVVVTLVREFDLKRRIKLLTHFIKICAAMYSLGNFNGVFEIVSGLHSSPVDRLKHMWAGLPSKRRKQFDSTFSALTHPSKNYETYRGILHERTTELPTLPYVGMFLSDLTFIEEGNPDLISPKDVDGAIPGSVALTNHPDIKLVNFYKRGLVANVIHLVQRFQQQNFVITKVDFLRHLLLSIHPEIVEEKETYASSLLAEPRETHA